MRMFLLLAGVSLKRDRKMGGSRDRSARRDGAVPLLRNRLGHSLYRQREIWNGIAVGDEGILVPGAGHDVKDKNNA